MKRSIFISVTLLPLLSSCAFLSTHAVASQTDSDSRFFNCQLPTASDRGPINPPLYVVGTFPDGAQWIQQENRKMSYKGDGIYQLVTDEKAGNVSLQFATMSWNPQFTAAGMEMTVNKVKQLKRAGFAKNTSVTLPADGRYVWTIQIAPDKKPIQTSVAQCK